MKRDPSTKKWFIAWYRRDGGNGCYSTLPLFTWRGAIRRALTFAPWAYSDYADLVEGGIDG